MKSNVLRQKGATKLSVDLRGDEFSAIKEDEELERGLHQETFGFWIQESSIGMFAAQ